jgi:hypothetical protein
MQIQVGRNQVTHRRGILSYCAEKRGLDPGFLPWLRNGSRPQCERRESAF